MTNAQIIKKMWIIIPLIAILNLATSLFTNYFKIPFFLDSWATSAGVMISNLGVGIAGGVLYNLIMAAALWGLNSWVWLFSSILVAILTYFFWKIRWVDILKPVHLILAGAITGLINSILVVIITFSLNPPEVAVLSNIGPLADAFNSLTHNQVLSYILQQAVIEIMDKSISIIMAALAVFYFLEFSRR